MPYPLYKHYPIIIPTLSFAAAISLPTSSARAFPTTLNDWQARYGAISPSGDNAECQLCHGEATGGSPWNPYGWDIGAALNDSTCDRDSNGTVSNQEAFFCVEPLNSDALGASNLEEILVGAQPGWRTGPANPLHSDAGSTLGNLPPADVGSIDPVGTEPLPPAPPPPSSSTTGARLWKQVVRPGQSIQAALDRALPGGYVYVQPGVYRELADRTNALAITRSVNLVGLSTRTRRVILQNAGNQRNGIVAVPDNRTQCMSCHSSLAPPFDLIPDYPEAAARPEMRGLVISGITITGFQNNGLFTENVNGFLIDDVRSEGNRNYGIFPTLSRNGTVRGSYASGSVDSGIWIETSDRILVTGNLVENNVNGFEISNSTDVELSQNISRYNSIGLNAVIRPQLMDEHPEFQRLLIRRNVFSENNRPNDADPSSDLALVPGGLGILIAGADHSVIEDNVVEGHDLNGIAVTDFCALLQGTPFDCTTTPGIPVEFLTGQAAIGNQVASNTVRNNGTAPDPTSPFAFAASDLALLTIEPNGNCFEDNRFATWFSLTGSLPTCE